VTLGDGGSELEDVEVELELELVDPLRGLTINLGVLGMVVSLLDSADEYDQLVLLLGRSLVRYSLTLTRLDA
jgi:hypothetical protein